MSEGGKLLKRKTAYTSKFVTVYEDEVELPNDTILQDYTVVRKPDVVIIVATDDKNNIVVLREYKYAVNEYLLSLPAGHREKDESSIETAKRELLEETGYVSDTYEELGILYDYPSKDCHKVYVVRALNIHKNGKTAHEETEHLSFQFISENILKKQIKNKDWKSSSAIAALALAGILH